MNGSILAIETTGRILSVALTAKGSATERRSETGLRHLTDLIPTVSAIMDDAGLSPATLDAIAVSAGPGSFTGIRIGISAARAIAQVTNLPVIKVPTLETLVYAREPGDIICPMLDARGGLIYCGAYRLNPKHNSIETIIPGGARKEQDFIAQTKAAIAAEGKATPARPLRDSDEPQSALHTLRWALSFGEPIHYAELEPIYMRKAEARRKLEERLAAQGLPPPDGCGE
jgi:tRNA threonylcarbamoyladenosine biosynthesis protein TsaB